MSRKNINQKNIRKITKLFVVGVLAAGFCFSVVSADSEDPYAAQLGVIAAESELWTTIDNPYLQAEIAGGKEFQTSIFLSDMDLDGLLEVSTVMVLPEEENTCYIGCYEVGEDLTNLYPVGVRGLEVGWGGMPELFLDPYTAGERFEDSSVSCEGYYDTENAVCCYLVRHVTEGNDETVFWDYELKLTGGELAYQELGYGLIPSDENATAIYQFRGMGYDSEEDYLAAVRKAYASYGTFDYHWESVSTEDLTSDQLEKQLLAILEASFLR